MGITEIVKHAAMPTLQEHINTVLCTSFLKEKDKAFFEAMNSNGLPTDEEFVKAHVQCIVYEDAPEFEHYWYHFGQSDAIRIISFEREPTVRLDQPDDLVKNNWKQTVEAKYY